MPKASREQQAVHRAAILDRASQLLREKGALGFSVPGLMADVGLTHGGFYKHFESKEGLLVQASDAAFAARAARVSELRADEQVASAARARFIDDYLSPWHRDHAAEGCAAAALAVDVGREGPHSPLRASYVGGVREMTRSLSKLQSEAEDKTDSNLSNPGVLADLATLVGAVLLARAASDDEISGQILGAARERLLGDRPSSR